MKNKFASQLETYEKFWNREKLSRPVISISAVGGEPYKPCESLEQKWFDENYIVGAALHTHKNTYYTAEGIPTFFTNLGPGCLAGCIGSGYGLTEKSIWYDQKPIIDDWENLPEIKLDFESDIWRAINRIQDKVLEHPELNTTITDLGGILDIICSLRGTENMLYDLYDYPDEVKEFTKVVTDIWFKAFDLQVEKIKQAGQPYNNWMKIPSSKPWYPLQCDFSYMISPAQFEEFVLPHITEQVNYMERSVYHLDGVGEIPHLDMLLDIEGLTAIQWVAGAGQPPLSDERWLPMYKKIQDKGKNLILMGGISAMRMEESERLIKSLDPTGVYISYTTDTKDKADIMLENVEKWCK